MKIDGHMPPQPVNTARLAGSPVQRPPARKPHGQGERVEISAEAQKMLKAAGAEATQAVQNGTGPSKAAQPAAKKA